MIHDNKKFQVERNICLQILVHMPVRTDRLLQILVLMVLSYKTLKTFLISFVAVNTGDSDIMSLNTDHGRYFIEKIVDNNNIKYVSDLSYSEFLDGLQDNNELLDEFVEILKQSRFKTYFLETPSINKKQIENKKFEFVLAKAETLENVHAEVEAFSQYFDQCSKNRYVRCFRQCK